LRSSAAIRSASRVLPTPPAPVNVNNRAANSRRFASFNSRRLPTKLVSSAGNLPTFRQTLSGTRRSIKLIQPVIDVSFALTSADLNAAGSIP
jgi:hypothetical protein